MTNTDFDYTAIDIDFDPHQQFMSGVAIHGNTPFSVPYISHIVGNLWTGGCTWDLILPDNIAHIVSLYPWEKYTINHAISTELSVRMYDSGDEVDSDKILRIADWVKSCVEDGPTLVHCQAGLNRSNLVAGAALTLMGYSGAEAIELLRERRCDAVLCNRTFESWLMDRDAS